MEYAVVRSGGKQYKVSKGLVVEVERIGLKVGESFNIEDVLLHVNNEGVVNLGNPISKEVKVKGTVTEHTRGEKLRVSKFKAKSKYRRVRGHKQHLSKIRIDEIIHTKRIKIKKK